MNSRNYSIDILKFVCAILVVFIHTDWYFQQEFLPVTRCAVPCFFMISGFLLFDNEQQTILKDRLKRNIIHVCKILLWATLFYMIWDETIYIFSNPDHQIWIPSVMRWVKLAVLNVPLFGHHLWYLFAYLYVLLIIVMVNKYDKWKYLWCIVPLLLLPHIVLLLSGRYLSIFLVRNFLFFGLPFFALGAFIKAKQNSLCKIRKHKILFLLGVILFALTSIGERCLLLSLGKFAERELYFSSFFLTVCLFLLALSSDMTQRSWLSELGEKDSLYIYIFHPVFVFCCRTFFSYFNLYDYYANIAPIVVLVTTMVFVKGIRLLKIIK